jgi:hypothetical protein
LFYGLAKRGHDSIDLGNEGFSEKGDSHRLPEMDESD